MTKEEFDKYLEDRYRDQVKWYGGKARHQQKRYRLFQWSTGGMARSDSRLSRRPTALSSRSTPPNSECLLGRFAASSFAVKVSNYRMVR